MRLKGGPDTLLWGIRGEKREIGNKKQPEAWVWALAVEWRDFAKVSCYLLALARLCYATEIPINRLVYRKEFGGKVFAIFLMLLSKRCSELLWSVLMLIGISLCSRFVIER